VVVAVVVDGEAVTVVVDGADAGVVVLVAGRSWAEAAGDPRSHPASVRTRAATSDSTSAGARRAAGAAEARGRMIGESRSA
jgi:hypothetical protein